MMPIPSPQERPDLYDDYDGRQEGQPSSVTVPPDIQKLIDAKKGGGQEDAGSDPEPESPAAENKNTA